MSEGEFEYSRIDLDRPSFRLIRLLSGSDTTLECDCELFDAYLDEVDIGGVPYEALSYAWGSLEKVAKIRINGMRMSVTENLFVALRHLRREDGDRILWIDALCIDQGNSKERGHQVQQMGDIYERAERVIVWLGTATVDTNFLMDFLKALPLDPMAHPASAVVPDDLNPRFTEGLEDLLGRPWFRRVWVLQEVAKARRADIVCGRRCVSTQIFTAAPFLLGMEPNFHTKAVLDVMPGRLRDSSWYNQKPTLLTLLQNFQRSEASDKRDMVYALIGMSSSISERNSLRADYKKDLQALVRKTTSVLLFPECPETLDFYYKEWGWHQLIKNLETLSSAAFSSAIRSGQTKGLEKFLDLTDINVNWRDEDRRTPLWWASKYENNAIVEMLAAREDTEVNLKDLDGRTPLRTAVHNGNHSTVRILLKSKNMEDISKNSEGKALLRLAAILGHKEVMKTFIEIGDIEVDSKDINGKTLLHVAAGLGHKDVLRTLLEIGVIEVNSKDNDGKTPLHVAAERGHEEVMMELLDIPGIEVDSTDLRGKTLLHLAAEKNHKEAMRALIEIGVIEANSKDNDGKTPLWIAVERGHPEVVRALLEIRGIEVDSKGVRDKTLLHLAVEKNYTEIAKSLLDIGGIDADAKDISGRTPLWVAAESGFKELAIVLLEIEGIEVNSKDRFGRTPLHIAASYGREEIVRALLKRKNVEINSEDNLKRTPLELAKRQRKDNIVRALLET